jgi:hypothetical protein
MAISKKEKMVVELLVSGVEILSPKSLHKLITKGIDTLSPEVRAELLAMYRPRLAAATTLLKDVSGREAISAQLDQISDGRFLSVEAMNEALRNLPGVEVEIPAAEIARLNRLFPAELSVETLAKIVDLKYMTEGEKGPLIMQLPKKVLVDGEKRPFSIAVMREIMRKASYKNKRLNSITFGIDDIISDSLKNEVWNSTLCVWTSDCLKYSKNKNYDPDQLKLQTDLLGEGYEIKADVILGMVLGHISGKESLDLRGSTMRINHRGDHRGGVLDVSVREDCSYGTELYTGKIICNSTGGNTFEIAEDFSSSRANSHTGIGASFRITE